MPAWLAWKTIGPLIGRFWWVVPIVALALWVWRIDTLRARHLEEREACAANHAQFAANVKAKTAEAMKADLENKARVETEQTRIEKDKDNAIRDRRDAARADRLRAGAAATDSRGGGEAGSARSANAAVDPARTSAAAQLHVADDLICIDAVIKAEGWQEWWRSVEAIPR